MTSGDNVVPRPGRDGRVLLDPVKPYFSRLSVLSLDWLSDTTSL